MAIYITNIFCVILLVCFQNTVSLSQEMSDVMMERLANLEEKVSTTEQLQRENQILKIRMNRYETATTVMDDRYNELKNHVMEKLQENDEKFEKMENKYLEKINILQDRQDKFEAKEIQYLETIKKLQNKLEEQESKLQNLQPNWEKSMSEGRAKNNKIEENEKASKIKIVNQNENNNTTGLGKQKYHDSHHRIDKRAEIVEVSTTVAFAASISASTLDHLGSGQVLVFDHVNVNEGNGYHASNGIFVCPLAGIYLFSFNLHLDGPNQRVAAEIKVNGKNILFSYSGTSSTTIKGNAPGTTVVRLNVGDHVWVGMYAGDDHVYGGTISNFMGVRIAN